MPALSLPQARARRCIGCRTGQRKPGALRCKASSTALEAPAQEAIDTLKAACDDPSIDKKKVFRALRTVQKEKLKGDDWGPIIGSGEYWRLVFTAGKGEVQASLKDDSQGSGYYFPLTAAQRFDLSDPPKGTLANAVYIPHVAAMQFSGDYTMSGKKLAFDLTGLKLKLGPLNLGPFKVGGGDKEGGGKGGPFFLFFYADEDIVCAQGASGGIALWQKATPEMVLKKGLDI